MQRHYGAELERESGVVHVSSMPTVRRRVNTTIFGQMVGKVINYFEVKH